MLKMRVRPRRQGRRALGPGIGNHVFPIWSAGADATGAVEAYVLDCPSGGFGFEIGDVT